MAETITAREANHHFSRILDEVAGGREYVVTRNGTPVARIVPERAANGRRILTPEQERLLAESLDWALKREVPADAEPIEKFDREEIYADRMPRYLRD